ncbi:predicted protein [Sparassis crispa]|uniref:Mtf2-like C-terminal domain-containing protein n=1 Tax=Sparassis crispa TaxID=139825 RepID=A0A401H0Q7_9APHY|nr:predicted protein [Sparassis crispa]GBE87992.1 predicted protein [Sparassis crispa]
MLGGVTLKKVSSRAFSQTAGTWAYTISETLAPKKLGESSKHQPRWSRHEHPVTNVLPAAHRKTSHLEPCRRSLCQSRVYSTSNTTGSPSDDKESIFSPMQSPWDHVFENIDDSPPVVPSVRGPQPLAKNTLSRAPRRQTMTAREITAFDEMFNMIFSAVEEQQHLKAADGHPRSLSAAIGRGRTPRLQLGDLFGQLRRQSRRQKWTTEADEELDRKKEEMELCDTDQQLLEWAMREVFGESRRYEENARRAMEDPAHAPAGLVQLQPQSYPHLLSLLMRTFRERYADPHLALSIFDHARHLSIPSFVFGCTTPAYNELIETRWRCFRDLRGVCDALEEMRVNGVEMDNRTRSLAEMIRREVGERNLWQEESTVGSGEVWDMVNRVERLTAKEVPKTHSRSRAQSIMKRKKFLPAYDTWKKKALQGNEPDDDWVFGEWDSPKTKVAPQAA